MVTKALLLTVCAIALATAFEYGRLTGKRKHAKSCWLQLNAQLNRYFDALAPLAKFLTQNGYTDTLMMTHFKKARDINKSGTDPKRRQAAYTHMQHGLARLRQMIQARENLAGDTTFISLWESIIRYDEKIRFETTFYNDAARAYNRLVARPPSSFVAKIFLFSHMPFFKIED